MFLVNGIKAILVMRNRTPSKSYYDDEPKKEVQIKVCPWGEHDVVKFGLYTVPEAQGYFMTHRWCKADIGDQLKYQGKTYSILKVEEGWIFNRIEFKILAVK